MHFKKYQPKRLIQRLATQVSHSVQEAIEQLDQLPTPSILQATQLKQVAYHVLHQPIVFNHQSVDVACSELDTQQCAQSPWFGPVNKRLTGLNEKTIFTPLNAHELKQRYLANRWHTKLNYFTQHGEQAINQVNQKIKQLNDRRYG